MKRTILSLLLLGTVTFFMNCHGGKKAMASKRKSSFDSDMKVLIVNYCSPCHIASNPNNKGAYDKYETSKADIADIIRRIELEPGQRGYMPKGRPKLNDSTINAFKKWRDDGMLEH